MRTTSSTRRALAALAVTALAAIGLQSPATATGEHHIGPDPTESSITAPLGPFATATVQVPASVSGFGGGVIHYPTGVGEPVGAVAFAPGFLGSSANYGWLGPRVASQGFVVLLMDTNTRLDNPTSRGAQLGAAIDYLVEDSAVAGLIDPGRTAVAGHSMGGGGTLEAALAHPGIDAAVALQPWHTDKTWQGITVPTMVIGAEDDTTAAVADHAEPMYESLTAASERAYVELAGADHRVGTRGDDTQARFLIAWLKRFVDNDSRYDQFLCPSTGTGPTVSDRRDSCPAITP